MFKARKFTVIQQFRRAILRLFSVASRLVRESVSFIVGKKLQGRYIISYSRMIIVR